VIRVLYVMTSLDVGGAERSLLELVRRLDRTQFEPTMCTLMSGGRMIPKFEQLGVRVFELGVGAGLAELNGARILPVFMRVRPHVIHSRLILSNLWARMGRPFASVICEERGLADDRPPFMTIANRASAPLVARMVANSEAVAARIRERDKIAADVIYGGIDTNRFSPANDSPTTDLVTVTRLEKYKGVFDLVEAMREVVARRASTTLKIYGGGGQRDALAARIAEFGLQASVELCGETNDVPARLREARVFVLASHEEGLPNSVMEAMATGLPVVATTVGGTPELVVDGVTGSLVPARDPKALAQALLAELDRPSGRGTAGRARALERFDVTRTVECYEALYRELA
jgi:glycosyltransferase involved in cell wall biosynthesis